MIDSMGTNATAHAQAGTRPRPEASERRTKSVMMLVAVVAAVVVIIGVYVALGYTAPATVQVGDNVSAYYTLRFQNGTYFDNVSYLGGNPPVNFTVYDPNNTSATRSIIPGFDQAVIGMQLHQIRNVTLPPAEAYGEVNASLIITISRSRFGNRTIASGDTVYTSSGLPGVIRAVNATNVTVDFNPRYAGQTLTFGIEVIRIGK